MYAAKRTNRAQLHTKNANAFFIRANHGFGKLINRDK